MQVKELENPDIIFETVIGLIVRLAEHGLIHCDFNEFNIMVFIFSPPSPPNPKKKTQSPLAVESFSHG